MSISGEIRVAVLAVLLSVSMQAWAQTPVPTYWQHDPLTQGEWPDPANWSNGLPTIGNAAYVENGGTAVISSDTVLDYLTVGHSDTGRVIQNAGAVNIKYWSMLGSTTGSSGSYALNGGSVVLNLGSDFVIAHGSFTQQAGTQLTAPRLVVGQTSGVSGSYSINGGLASIDELYVLPSGSVDITGGQLLGGGLGVDGILSQSAGSVQTTGVEIGSYAGDSGTYRLSGPSSTLLCVGLTVGYSGIGRFYQDGATVAATDVRIGSNYDGNGWYNLAQGSLSANTIHIAGEIGSTGGFTQSGGIVQVRDMLSVNAAYGTSANYQLSDGQLSAQQEYVGNTALSLPGEFHQTGGDNIAGYLCVGPGNKYEYSGGWLQVTGLTSNGILDFAGSNVTLLANSGIINLSRGNVLNAGNATFLGGNSSLIILPAGSTTPGPFGSIASIGLVHVAGTPLTLKHSDGITGWGEIDDPVIVPDPKDYTTPFSPLVASSGGFINLNNGLTIPSGSARATVDLGTGSLTVKADGSGVYGTNKLRCGSITIAAVGGSAFVHEGDISVSGAINIGSDGTGVARYDHRGGSLGADTITVREGGKYQHSGGSLTANSLSIFSSAGDAVVDQSNGWIAATKLTVDQGGSYFLSGNSSLRATYEYVRQSGSFQQTGGTNTNDNSLWLDPTAIYQLSGGELSSGSESIRGGSFVQSGGTNTVRGSSGLVVKNMGSTAGSYVLAGGVLSTPNLTIGAVSATAPSIFAIESRTAQVTIGSTLQLGAGGALHAVPGSVIEMTLIGLYDQSSLDNRSTKPANWSDLGNVRMLFDGGASDVATLEVGGRDLGGTLSAFHSNFALGTLQIGDGATRGQVMLQDSVDNQTLWSGSEALYVDRLIMGPGSSLNLNGLKLFCIVAEIDPSAMITGGSVSLLPPSALLAGDADGDGKVSFLDYLTLETNFGKTGMTWRNSDFNGDGKVSFADYVLLEQDFGMSTPEPATLSLLSAGLALLMTRRRR